MKNCDEPLSKVYIKNYLHPAVMKELDRIRKREKRRKREIEYAGATITYDWKNHVLLKDGVVIDRYSPYFV